MSENNSQLAIVPQHIQTLSSGLAKQIQDQQPDISPNGQCWLAIGKKAPIQGISDVAAFIDRYRAINQDQRLLSMFWLGRCINEYAARKNITIEEALVEMKLTNSKGQNMREYVQMARLDQMIPENRRYFNVTPTHYRIIFLECKSPDLPEDLAKYREKQFAILNSVHGNPRDRSTKWAKAEMVALREEFGLITQRTKSKITLQFLTQCHLALLDWTDEDFEKHGTTRKEVNEWRTTYETQLTEIDALPNIEDPKFKFHFQKQKKEGQRPRDEPEPIEGEQGALDVEAEEIPAEEPETQPEPDFS